MRRLAIIYGATTLGWALIKALFIKNTYIHRCPECNLVIKKNISKCVRCDTLFDWS